MSLGNSLNNPGNLRKSSIVYKGEVPNNHTGLAAQFKQFVDMQHGFRAMAEDLYSYVVHGTNTLSAMINKYAPAGDGSNNPVSYIHFVSSNAGVDPNATISKEDFKSNGGEPLMLGVIRWMTRDEEGAMPDEDLLTEGYDLFAQDNNLA